MDISIVMDTGMDEHLLIIFTVRFVTNQLTLWNVYVEMDGINHA